jgi:lipopolysaccharide transport system ATP-binding protein
VAIHADPVCFIVDEALAVGDARFQQKCLKRIKEFRERGGSILYVSHDINSVKLLCDRALLLANGRIEYDGAPDAAAQNYYRHIAGVEADSQREASLFDGDYGARRTRIVRVAMTSGFGAGTRFASGEPVTIDVECESVQDAALSVGILVRDRFGQDVFGTNTAILETPVRFERGSRASCHFSLPLNFAPGKYTLTVAIHSDETHVHDCQHWWDAAVTFEIAGFLHTPFSGLCYVPVEFQQHDVQASLTPVQEIHD